MFLVWMIAKAVGKLNKQKHGAFIPGAVDLRSSACASLPAFLCKYNIDSAESDLFMSHIKLVNKFVRKRKPSSAALGNANGFF